MKHYTPFTVHEGTRCYTIKDLRGAVVAEMPAARASDYDLALQFAAAPELLEALQIAHAFMAQLFNEYPPLTSRQTKALQAAEQRARAAIAKAEGDHG
jgi:hypothetical protein